MKKYIIFVTLFFSLFFFSSCMDDYLDAPSVEDEASVSSEVAFGTKEGVKASMAGILRKTRVQFSATTASGVTDAGGIYSLLFARSVKGNNIIIPNNWYATDYQHANREPNYRRPTFTWEFPYTIIALLNDFMDGIQSHGLKDDKDFINPYLAQAKTLRAYYYFQLAMEFQHTYAKDPSAVAPPIYEHRTLESNPMSTLQEMYDLILKDLDFSLNKGYLNQSRHDKSWVNDQVANGIAANVYLVMENWEEALKRSKIAANFSNASSIPNVLNDTLSYKYRGFNSMLDKEWIWAMPQQADQSNYYYLSPHTILDHRNPAYNSGYINVEFAKQFSATDYRGKAILKLYNVADTDARARVTDKFVFAFDSDAPLMRTPEMVLIAAESNYRLGNEAEAKNMLYALQSIRDGKAVKSNTSGSDLLEEILLERKKELYGEIGVEWFDAKRLQRGIVRDGNHSVKVTLAPNDNRFILKIPKNEIDANPHIPSTVNDNR